MNTVENQFLELLRAGLWEGKADEALFAGEVDWKGILRLAEKQTVVGLVAEGIYSLPEERRPPKEAQYKLHLYLVRLQQSHLLLNQVLKELVDFFTARQIPAVLLKGQGLAQLYPKPERRGCGDIDLYVGTLHYRRACELMKEFGDPSDEEETESVKHLHCHRKGVSIEIHRLAEDQFGPILDARFQKWTEKHLGTEGQFEKWNLEGTTVCLPPVQFNVLYILNHLTHHLVMEGVGLRQVCDWVRYVYVCRDKFDREVLRQDLQSLGMWNFWKVFSVFAVDFLGYPATDFPFYDASMRAKAVALWSWMERVGNFGKHAEGYRRKRPKAYLWRKLDSFCHYFSGKKVVFSVFPKEVATAMGWYVLGGIKRVCLGK